MPANNKKDPKKKGIFFQEGRKKIQTGVTRKGGEKKMNATTLKTAVLFSRREPHILTRRREGYCGISNFLCLTQGVQLEYLRKKPVREGGNES